MRWALLWLGIAKAPASEMCLDRPALQAPGEGVKAPGGRARRPLVLLAEAIDAPEVTVAPDLAQGRDVVQRALHELADLGDGARGV